MGDPRSDGDRRGADADQVAERAQYHVVGFVAFHLVVACDPHSDGFQLAGRAAEVERIVRHHLKIIGGCGCAVIDCVAQIKTALHGVVERDVERNVCRAARAFRGRDNAFKCHRRSVVIEKRA